MARLQDFQTVTPTSSDKLLVVQSQSQGLVPYGSKLDSANPTGIGALSLNRASGSTVGANSTAEGLNCIASGNQAHAEGRETTASNTYTHSEGYATKATGDLGSHAEGNTTEARGRNSHAEGQGTIATHRGQHVHGEYNLLDASTAVATSRGNYVEIVGNGTGTNARSNARTLDWSGNEVLAGDCIIKGNKSLDDAITPSLVNLTYAQGVSYVSGGVYWLGKIVVVALRITIGSDISTSGSNVVSGLPRPARTGTYSSPYVRILTINGNYAVNDGGVMLGYNATAGTTIINGIYIAD